MAGAEASAAEIKWLLNLTAKVDKLETWRLTALSAWSRMRKETSQAELGLDELLDSLNLIVENNEAGTGDRVTPVLANIADDANRLGIFTGSLAPCHPPRFSTSLDELNKRDPATAPLLTHWKSY